MDQKTQKVLESWGSIVSVAREKKPQPKPERQNLLAGDSGWKGAAEGPGASVRVTPGCIWVGGSARPWLWEATGSGGRREAIDEEHLAGVKSSTSPKWSLMPLAACWTFHTVIQGH